MDSLEHVYRAAISGVPAFKTGSGLLLDSMNYSSSLFHDPLSLRDIIRIFDIEIGYGSSDGSYELTRVVKAYEQARSLAGIDRRLTLTPRLHDLGVIVSQGATGVLHAVVSGAKLRARALGLTRTELAYATPHYPLANSLAKLLDLLPVPVHPPAGTYLPTPSCIREHISDRTLACIISLPSNPYHQFWDLQLAQEYRTLVEHCQTRGVLVVVDAIFEEMIWSGGPVPALLSLVDTGQHLCRVFSPSKDRPFAAGYRIGYALVHTDYHNFIASAQLVTGNSASTLSLLWFALDLTFRLAMLEGTLQESHCELLSGNALFGYGRPEPLPSELFDKITSNYLFQTYAERVSDFYSKLKMGLLDIIDGVATLRNLRIVHCPHAGNSLMIEIDRPRVRVTAERLFHEAFHKLGLCLVCDDCFELPRSGPVQFRVVYAAAATGSVLRALAKLDALLDEL